MRSESKKRKKSVRVLCRGIIELECIYWRVLESLELELLDIDPLIFWEGAISSFAHLKVINRDLTWLMSKQGSLLWNAHNSHILLLEGILCLLWQPF